MSEIHPIDNVTEMADIPAVDWHQIKQHDFINCRAIRTSSTVVHRQMIEGLTQDVHGSAR
ncbi:hypothetical protein N7457_003251 [Penicillium paradoxum]|uniref:uncharacterized protein n=1 Tax=Penicillium paradoxum TaxID=176176 RepID=UPI0025483814|nr:uncharacterized protein N7457_003251 [Penicillium paradoxum]KAJ5788261.1 hypothetical protein N7457_003251 [Penicillium paradoxum]